MQRLVRIRVTHARDGAVETSESVYCPTSAAAIPLDECMTCRDRIGYKSDPLGADAWVACRRARGDDDDAPDAVSLAMTRAVHCVRADVAVGAVETLLLAHAIGGVPVLGEGDRLVGVASIRDVVRHRHDGGDPAAPVAAIMNPHAITIGEHEPTARAAARMAFEHVHRLPVVDEVGAVIGIVTALDLVRWLAHEQGFVL